jgi:rubredoxin
MKTFLEWLESADWMPDASTRSFDVKFANMGQDRLCPMCDGPIEKRGFQHVCPRCKIVVTVPEDRKGGSMHHIAGSGEAPRWINPHSMGGL